MARIHEFVALQKRGVVSVPAVIRERLHLDEPGAQLEFLETDDGTLTVRGVVPVPSDQKWFWTERWQQMEREADEDIAAGRIVGTESVDELFAEMDG